MLPSHPLYYFSTHNALRGADGDDLHFRVCFEELHGSRSCELDVYPFYDVQMVKRLLIKKLRLPSSMQVIHGNATYSCISMCSYTLCSVCKFLDMCPACTLAPTGPLPCSIA